MTMTIFAVIDFHFQGVVYFDSCVLGWRCVFKRWCANRSSQEGDTLTKYLGEVMDPIVEFVLIKSG